MKAEIIDKLAALITAAFGLVAALAWNDTIKKIFDSIFGQGSTIGAMLGYSITVTVVAVFATLWIGNAANKAKELEIKKVVK